MSSSSRPFNQLQDWLHELVALIYCAVKGDGKAAFRTSFCRGSLLSRMVEGDRPWVGGEVDGFSGDRDGICGMGFLGDRDGICGMGVSVDRDRICGMGISVDRGQDERGSSLHWMNERSSQSIHVQFIFITVSLP
jgi:hypothetical protein